MAEKPTLLFATADTQAQKGYGIDTGKEFQYINEAFVKATCHPLFELGANSIGPKLMQYVPDILHISAHGTINGKLVVEEGIEEELKMDAGRFASFLVDYRKHLQLVVFCVCHSGSMAMKTIRSIPVSIGFEYKLEDEAAKMFSRRFYEVLNESPHDYYGAYLRAKKEIGLGGATGKGRGFGAAAAPGTATVYRASRGPARFYFNREEKYRWNAAAWKRVLKILQEKRRLEEVRPC